MSENWKAETVCIPDSFSPQKSPSPWKVNEISGLEVSNYNVAMLKDINHNEILVVTDLLQFKERLLRKHRLQKQHSIVTDITGGLLKCKKELWFLTEI